MTSQVPGLAAAQLIPAEAVFCGPTPFGTADGGDGCFCADGSGYIIKKNVPQNPQAAHNEWFCANLALASDVPVAPFNIVKHTDGELWFGSQYRVGEIPDWWNSVASGEIPVADVVDDLSKIYALDLFINNVDRHIKNFLVVRREGGASAMAMDHGRCWTFSGFPPAEPPFSPHCNTINAFTWMSNEFAGYPNRDAIRAVLKNIGEIAVGRVEDIFANEPANWLPADVRNGIIEWWREGNAAERAQRLINGVNDGSLL